MEQTSSPFRLPILTYHHISDEIDYYTCVTPSIFRKQIREITKEFGCISLEEAVQRHERNEPPSEKFALTFDDGYQDTVPMLQEIAGQGLSATVFIATDHIAKDNRWNYKAPYITKVMAEDDIRQITAAGHAVESHAQTHQCLTKLPDEELRLEFAESRRVIEQLLGTEVKFFAYPFGLHDARVREFAAKKYRAAFATHKTAASEDWIDLFQIHRLSVNRDTPLPAILHYLYGTNT